MLLVESVVLEPLLTDELAELEVIAVVVAEVLCELVLDVDDVV